MISSIEDEDSHTRPGNFQKSKVVPQKTGGDSATGVDSVPTSRGGSINERKKEQGQGYTVIGAKQAARR